MNYEPGFVTILERKSREQCPGIPEKPTKKPSSKLDGFFIIAGEPAKKTPTSL